jgi:hypothetical protein
MDETMHDEPQDTQATQEAQDEDSQENISQEIPAENVFIAPSIHKALIQSGDSYTHCSDIPQVIRDDMSTECVLGVDEAGRGPVLGIILHIVTTLLLQANLVIRSNGIRSLLSPPLLTPHPPSRHAPLRRLESANTHLPLLTHAKSLHALHRPLQYLRLVSPRDVRP